MFQNVSEGAGKSVKQPLIIALDFSSINDVQQFLMPFQQESLFVKVGMELFYKERVIHYFCIKRAKPPNLFRLKAS